MCVHPPSLFTVSNISDSSALSLYFCLNNQFFHYVLFILINYLLRSFGIILCFSLQETYKAKHIQYLEERNQREMEMRTLFAKKVKDKEAELKAAHAAVYAYTHTQI